jgi:hypothetical protein
MTEPELREYLNKNHYLLNFREIERLAGIPIGTISHKLAMETIFNPIHFHKIEPIIKQLLQ